MSSRTAGGYQIRLYLKNQRKKFKKRKKIPEQMKRGVQDESEVRASGRDLKEAGQGLEELVRVGAREATGTLPRSSL